MNKTIVLDTIRQRQPLSRADISTAIGLNKATVSSLVSELIDSRLVAEIGPGESSGGRKPTLLLFNRSAGYAIGIDIRVNDLLAVLVDLEGNVLQEKTATLADSSPDSVLEQIRKAIRQLAKKLPDSAYGIVGIGIGVPGLVDENSRVVSAPNLGWNQVDLLGPLAADRANIHIDNEANAGAIGEKLYGAGRDALNLIYLSIGIGIGLGDHRGRGAVPRHLEFLRRGRPYDRGRRRAPLPLRQPRLLGDLGLRKSAAGPGRQAVGPRGSRPGADRPAGPRGRPESGPAPERNRRPAWRRFGQPCQHPEPRADRHRQPAVAGRRSAAGSNARNAGKPQPFLSSQKSHVAFANLGIRSTALGAASMPITAFLADPHIEPADA
ncbi:hypothetical protein HMSSN036_12700 [Paenibacillus macerans]|nr:hypothetical protein HMSSN036_12700 [Paenibacillus macerans]